MISLSSDHDCVVVTGLKYQRLSGIAKVKTHGKVCLFYLLDNQTAFKGLLPIGDVPRQSESMFCVSGVNRQPL